MISVQAHVHRLLMVRWAFYEGSDRAPLFLIELMKNIAEQIRQKNTLNLKQRNCTQKKEKKTGEKKSNKFVSD